MGVTSEGSAVSTTARDWTMDAAFTPRPSRSTGSSPTHMARPGEQAADNRLDNPPAENPSSPTRAGSMCFFQDSSPSKYARSSEMNRRCGHGLTVSADQGLRPRNPSLARCWPQPDMFRGAARTHVRLSPSVPVPRHSAGTRPRRRHRPGGAREYFRESHWWWRRICGCTGDNKYARSAITIAAVYCMLRTLYPHFHGTDSGLLCPTTGFMGSGALCP